MRLNILKALCSIFLVIIIAISGIVWYSANQVEELQNQNNKLTTQLTEQQNQISDLQNQTNMLQTQNNDLQNQVNEMQKQISYLQNIKIANFSLNGFDNPVGLVWNTKFIVNIQNNLPYDISNVTLIFDVISVFKIDREITLWDSQLNILSWGLEEKSYILGVPKSGNTTLEGVIWNNLNDDAKLHGSSFVVTLKVGDIVLDKATINM